MSFTSGPGRCSYTNSYYNNNKYSTSVTSSISWAGLTYNEENSTSDGTDSTGIWTTALSKETKKIIHTIQE